MKYIFLVITLFTLLSCGSGTNAGTAKDSTKPATDTAIQAIIPADTTAMDTTHLAMQQKKMKRIEKKQLRMEKRRIQDSLKNLK